VHRELFHLDDVPPRARATPQPRAGSTVSIVLDGRTTRFAMPPDGRSILEAALEMRPDAPFACKGGVCGTCRCRLVDGDVEMTHRYALEDDEIAAGVRLACQSVPTSPEVVVDFDLV
jgi:ring-1,2-phenylacetyl-CoA epoxidase subunit PaaE